MIVSNDMKVHFAQQHELIENTLTGTDVQIIKFHNELLRSITELYAIPPERLRKVIQENNLKDTKARKIIKVKRAHTLYKALNDSLDYIKNKYFKE
jgi:Asp-tRNA(Asn)/Glu-tRNA(Gln) amidotransferase B subunit